MLHGEEGQEAGKEEGGEEIEEALLLPLNDCMSDGPGDRPVLR